MKQTIFTSLVLGALTQHGFAQPAAPAPGPATPSAEAPSADDLAKAADATADAAAVPPGQPAPAAPASGDDVDLSALGLDIGGGGSFDDKLNIYGFADFTYYYHTALFGSALKTFELGRLNVYFARNLTQRWRALAEIRYMFVPNGSGGGGNAPTLPSTTTVPDPTDFGRAVAWGGISIQRATLEYDLAPHLTIRAGYWLTPYGIWNIDHGSPTILSPYAPHIIGEELFPDHQTGIQLLGSVFLGNYRIGYTATASNGRSEVDSTQDPDSRIALGGRVELEAPWAGTLKLGASGYGGRTTRIAIGTNPSWAYDERDFAVDGQWDHGGLHLQAEYIHHQRNSLGGEASSAPPGLMAGPSLETTTGVNHGYYVLAGYRFDRLWNVMPLAFYQDWWPMATSLKISELNVGLNFRPTATVVLKLMASEVWFIDPPPGAPTDPLKNYTAQAAWVF